MTTGPLFPRRRLLRLACLLPLAALARPLRAFAGEALAFKELYGSIGVLGLTFSDKVNALAGQTVTMRGFMAPPLKAEAKFFVLSEIPMSICPFCSSDADWPDTIVVVTLDHAQTFTQANAPIEVTGRLDVGSWTDPETGFVSLLRLTGASFRKV